MICDDERSGFEVKAVGCRDFVRWVVGVGDFPPSQLHGSGVSVAVLNMSGGFQMVM